MADAPQEPGGNRGSTIIAAALVASALIVSYGMSSATPRYQLVASGTAVVRMDNDSGEIIACDLHRCAQVQPPDRARALQPLTNLVGGGGDDDNAKQLPAPRER